MVTAAPQRKRVAPYAAAGSLSAFFDHIRYVKTPDRVDSGLLEDYGVTKSQTFPVLSTLKFLGLTEADGSSTPAFRALQTGGTEFQDALREIVQRAYAELFDRLDVSRDTRDKITNYFARNYSPATAEKATALFLDLCGEAGIQTAAMPRGEKPDQPRPTQPRTPRKTEPRAPKGNGHTPGTAELKLTTYPPVVGPRVVLEVRLTEDDLGIMSADDIKSVFEAAGKIEIARTLARNRAAHAEQNVSAEVQPSLLKD